MIPQRLQSTCAGGKPSKARIKRRPAMEFGYSRATTSQYIINRGDEHGK